MSEEKVGLFFEMEPEYDEWDDYDDSEQNKCFMTQCECEGAQRPQEDIAFN